MKTLRNTAYLGLILISLLFMTAAWKVSEPFKLLQDQISKIDSHAKRQSRKIYLVLPNQGCEGCISTVEDFAIKNYRNKNLAFIFTRVNSRKLLRIKLTDKVLKQPNVFIDLNNIISYPKSDMQIYPMIVFTENGKVTNVDYESPTTGGIGTLRMYAQKYFSGDQQIL